MRGFNWIPDDCFPSRTTRADLAQRFGQAIDAGANALRVWGGGVYESDDFYDLADELGLLVWQDFPFACAAYPEDEPIAGEVAAEARDNVVRLMSHPSLALWCGNNENVEGYQHWGWQEELGDRDLGRPLSTTTCCRPSPPNSTPRRPYWPSTPYSGAPDRDTHDATTGTSTSGRCGTRPTTRTTPTTPRVSSPSSASRARPPTRRCARPSPTNRSPPTRRACGTTRKPATATRKLLRGLGEHLPRPTTFDDWHYYTQLNQARAVSFGVRRFRALMPYCMGTIVWQLNDCWPVTSWSAVDGYARRETVVVRTAPRLRRPAVTFQDDEIALGQRHRRAVDRAADPHPPDPRR